MKIKKKSDLSIVEAIEMLSSISELKKVNSLAIDKEYYKIIEKEELSTINEVNLKKQDGEVLKDTIKIMKKTFKVVFNYLNSFYKNSDIDKKKSENIDKIMILAREAAKKLDKRANSVKGNKKNNIITKLKEYKELESFYRTKIVKEHNKDFLGSWLTEFSHQYRDHVVTQNKGLGNLSDKNILDLDGVKKDLEYELLFIKKANNQHFYNPKLVRSIKLICGFGNYFDRVSGKDPFLKINLWMDHSLQVTSKQIIQSLELPLASFYKAIKRRKETAVINLLKKSIFSLILSSHPRNLLRNSPVKSSISYFNDFQYFFRKLLKNRDFHHLVLYPEEKKESLNGSILNLAYSMADIVYTKCRGFQEGGEELLKLVWDQKSKSFTDSHKKEKSVCKQLLQNYNSLNILLEGHASAPLHKALDFLEGEEDVSFDPIIQHNQPNLHYKLQSPSKEVSVIRYPFPTSQEVITKAKTIDEFIMFIRSYTPYHSGDSKKHLLFNLQSRNFWGDSARSKVIEKLQSSKELKEQLSVVTLSKNSSFYHQIEPYHNLSHVDDFIKVFYEQLTEKDGEYFFPSSVKKQIFPVWTKNILIAIHQFFFSGKSVLSRNDRLNFIEIFYSFLQLKVLEIESPDSLSFVCKDGIDAGPIASSQLLFIIQLINNKKVSEENWKQIFLSLWSPVVLVRERNLLPNIFIRMVNTIQLVESKKGKDGATAFVKEFKKTFKKFFTEDFTKLKTSI